jgi:hypothetical protein
VAINFSVAITGVPGAGTRNVAITLANQSRTIQIEPHDFIEAPSAAEFREAVTTLLRAAWWAQTGTPAQRIAALEAGITKLAFKNYRTDTMVNP